MTFRVGQKVVCVSDDFAARNARSNIPPSLPKLNQVYTVREFVEARGKRFLRLVEIVNPNGIVIGVEPAFALDRFRPVVDRSTDISFAHEILRKATRKDRVPA